MECLQYFRQSFSDWSDTVGFFFCPDDAFPCRRTKRFFGFIVIPADFSDFYKL